MEDESATNDLASNTLQDTHPSSDNEYTSQTEMSQLNKETKSDEQIARELQEIWEAQASNNVKTLIV